ncbi:MAG: hypothetical protein JO132_12965 [Streptosporangiaceae bacterium]|nr:hypothetical protein [Streptosporangiaceae bacterium]
MTCCDATLAEPMFPSQRWGGFRVLPARVEFWQESPDGLHDRIRYRRGDDGWIIERLAP